MEVTHRSAENDAAGEPPAAPVVQPLSPFSGPTNIDVDLDFGILNPSFVTNLPADGSASSEAGSLLPSDVAWQQTADAKRQRVPLPLCEFLAYRAALAYEKRAVVKVNVGRHDAFDFFDSTITDTQGYAFARDGVAYIVMRGTESRGDWTVNLDDALTDSLAVPPSWLLRQRLRWRYGGEVFALVDRVKEVRGRHRGFALAWAAVEDQVMQFVAKLPAGTPIVLSGHSLGGALAQIGAYALSQRDQNVAAVVTFGAPWVGNADFAKAYDNRKLKDRTVLLESKSDSVPQIMRRWYYMLNRELQQFVLNLIEPPEARATSTRFASVSDAWPFSKEPALKDNEITQAIKAIVDERTRIVARELERELEKAKQLENRKKEAADKNHTRNDGAEKTPAGDKPQSPAGQNPAGETGTASDGAGRMVLMVIAAIMLLVVMLMLWVFIRGKLSSHAIMHRYALFLSTLSYQRIRSFYANSTDGMEMGLKHADANLDMYLRYIRGVQGDYKGTFYQDVAALPVRLKLDYDLATFSSVEKNII